MVMTWDVLHKRVPTCCQLQNCWHQPVSELAPDQRQRGTVYTGRAGMGKRNVRAARNRKLPNLRHDRQFRSSPSPAQCHSDALEFFCSG